MFVTVVVSAAAMPVVPVGYTDYTTVVVDSPAEDNHVTVYIVNDTHILVFS